MKSICTIRSRAAVIFTRWLLPCLLGLLLTGPARADRAPPAATSAGDIDEQASTLISQIEKAGTAEELMTLSQQLIELRPAPIDLYKAHLSRSRQSSNQVRRAVLVAAGADVPDKNGRFRTPRRQTKKVERNNDKFDWLTALSELSAREGLGESVADVAVIRALAASQNPEAGAVIIDFAFSEEGLIYRDECGRFLRKMSPYSLPALIRGSQNRKRRSMRRYTTYQLERLDRQNPHKAFAAAPTESLQIAIVEAFADSQYREAVFAVLEQVDHVAPRVREATRAAWMEYVAGREPPKPPERKLELPNGKLSDEPAPLWLDHRQLARTAIRARLEELTGQEPIKNASLTALTEQLFGFYDERRKKALNTDFEAALSLARAGKAEQATVIFDRILAQRPDFSRRADMVPAYLAQAEALEAQEKFAEAGVAYGKASAVAPNSEAAEEARKKHHLARAKALESSGGDASTELAIAQELGGEADESTQDKLILFAGLAAVAGAIVLLIIGFAIRRRPTQAQ